MGVERDLCVSVSLWLIPSVFSRPLSVGIDRDVPEPDPEAVRVLGVTWVRAAAAARCRGRRRHDAPRDVPASARSGALERRVRSTVAPPRGRPLWREPEPPLQAPPVPGHPQAGSRRGAAALSRQSRGVRHQPAPARHPLRGGQLGVSDARGVGHRLAGDVRRHGNLAVHLLSAGWRHGARADLGRADLRARAHRDGAAAGRQRLRPRVGARREVRRRAPARGSGAVEVRVRAGRDSRRRVRRVPPRSLRTVLWARGGTAEGGPDLAGAGAHAEVLAPVQHPRFEQQHRRHRADRVHPPHPAAGDWRREGIR